MCVHSNVPWCSCGDQRTTSGGHFPSSTLWVWESNSGLTGLVAAPLPACLPSSKSLFIYAWGSGYMPARDQKTAPGTSLPLGGQGLSHLSSSKVYHRLATLLASQGFSGLCLPSHHKNAWRVTLPYLTCTQILGIGLPKFQVCMVGAFM